MFPVLLTSCGPDAMFPLSVADELPIFSVVCSPIHLGRRYSMVSICHVCPLARDRGSNLTSEQGWADKQQGESRSDGVLRGEKGQGSAGTVRWSIQTSATSGRARRGGWGLRVERSRQCGPSR